MFKTNVLVIKYILLYAQKARNKNLVKTTRKYQRERYCRWRNVCNRNGYNHWLDTTTGGICDGVNFCVVLNTKQIATFLYIFLYVELLLLFFKKII